MDIDLVQVATNLIVGAAGAWVAGKFGIRHGLEKAKGERALERRLTWYEKALRATMKFRNFNEEIALAIGKNDLTTLERMVSGNLQVTRSLQRTINESLVFADKSTYLRLKRVFKEFQRKMDEMNQDLAKQGPSMTFPSSTNLWRDLWRGQVSISLYPYANNLDWMKLLSRNLTSDEDIISPT